MQIQLEQIFNLSGSFKDIDYSFEPECPLSDDFVLTAPIRFIGRVENKVGIVSITGKATFSATVTCSRCAEDFYKDFSVDISHLLARNLQNEENDEFIVVEDNTLELDLLVFDDIVLSMPYRFLCSEDCKGLCPKCGKNLNQGKCDCKKDIDPRMAALLELLD